MKKVTETDPGHTSIRRTFVRFGIWFKVTGAKQYGKLLQISEYYTKKFNKSTEKSESIPSCSLWKASDSLSSLRIWFFKSHCHLRWDVHASLHPGIKTNKKRVQEPRKTLTRVTKTHLVKPYCSMIFFTSGVHFNVASSLIKQNWLFRKELV